MRRFDSDPRLQSSLAVAGNPILLSDVPSFLPFRLTGQSRHGWPAGRTALPARGCAESLAIIYLTQEAKEMHSESTVTGHEFVIKGEGTGVTWILMLRWRNGA